MVFVIISKPFWTNRNYFFSSWSYLFQLFHAFLSMLMLTVAFVEVFHFLIWNNWLLFFEILISSVRLWQVNYTIVNYRLHRFPTIRYLLFVYIKSIQYIFNINPYLSEAFLVYNIVNAPISALFVMNILFSVGGKFYRFAITVVVFTQFIVCFQIHYFIAKINHRIKRQCIDIIPFSLHRKYSLNTSIRLNLFIQRFHTKNAYGFTYGKFGLITMFALVKVSQ